MAEPTETQKPSTAGTNPNTGALPQQGQRQQRGGYQGGAQGGGRRRSGPNQQGGQGHGQGGRGRGDGPQSRQDSDAKLLDLSRVTRVAAGGRRFRFRAVVVSGDKAGHVGVGVAKGADVAQAVEKATRQAKKKAITVPIVEGTIPHEVEAKFGASKVLLRPQKGGRGLVAGGPVRIICEFAGIQNVSGKFLSKTHNKLNNALATLEALKKLKVRSTKSETATKDKNSNDETAPPA